MAKNLLGRMFNTQPKPEEEARWAENQAQQTQQSVAKPADGLTSVERYLLNKQGAQQTTATQEQPVTQQVTEKPATATTVAKYIEKKETPVLTGVARYLVKQIIPEYKIRAEEAAKAAAPTSVEVYISKIIAVAAENQPAVPTGVETYLKKLG